MCVVEIIYYDLLESYKFTKQYIVFFLFCFKGKYAVVVDEDRKQP